MCDVASFLGSPVTRTFSSRIVAAGYVQWKISYRRSLPRTTGSSGLVLYLLFVLCDRNVLWQTEEL
jgi:hypothetical protein